MIHKKKTAIGCGLLVLMVFTVLTWALVEPFVLTVTEVTIKKKDIPEALNGFRIAHLSDIHHGRFVSLRFVRKVVEMTNRLDPDMIFITGDFVSWDNKYAKPCLEVLKDLKSRHGVLAILGNYDKRSFEKDDLELMERSGIELVSRTRPVNARGASFKVEAITKFFYYPWVIESTLSDVENDDFVILLAHNPDVVDHMPEDAIDLLLAGHTHGGQVTFFGLYSPILNIKSGQKYRGGVVHKGPMTVVISKGIGTSDVPLRFFCPPEIVLITLEHGDE